MSKSYYARTMQFLKDTAPTALILGFVAYQLKQNRATYLMFDEHNSSIDNLKIHMRGDGIPKQNQSADTKTYYARSMQFLKTVAPTAVILGLVAYQFNQNLKLNRFINSQEVTNRTLWSKFNRNLTDQEIINEDLTYQINEANGLFKAYMV